MTTGTDTLFCVCPCAGCDYEVRRTVPCGTHLTPSAAVRVHRQMIRHIEATHGLARPITRSTR